MSSSPLAKVPYTPSVSLYPPVQRCPSRQTGAIVTRHYDSGLNPFDALATQREAVRRASPLSVSALTSDLMETEEQKVKRHRIIPMTLALESEYWQHRIDKHRTRKEKEKRRKLKEEQEENQNHNDTGSGAESGEKGGDDGRETNSIRIQRRDNTNNKTWKAPYHRHGEGERRRSSVAASTARLLDSSREIEFAGIKLSSNEKGVRGMQHAKQNQILNYIENPYADRAATTTNQNTNSMMIPSPPKQSSSHRIKNNSNSFRQVSFGKNNSPNNNHNNDDDYADDEGNHVKNKNLFSQHGREEDNFFSHDDEDDDTSPSTQRRRNNNNNNNNKNANNQNALGNSIMFDVDDDRNQALLFSSSKASHLGHNQTVASTANASAAASVRRVQEEDNRRKAEQMKLQQAKRDHAMRRRSVAKNNDNDGDQDKNNNINLVSDENSTVTSVVEVPAGFASQTSFSSFSPQQHHGLVSASLAKSMNRGTDDKIEIDANGSFIKLPAILQRSSAAQNNKTDSSSSSPLAGFMRHSSMNLFNNNNNSNNNNAGGGGKSGSNVETSSANYGQNVLSSSSVAASSNNNNNNQTEPVQPKSVLPLHREQTDRKAQQREDARHVSDFYKHLLPADVKYRARATHSMILKQARQEVLKRHSRKTNDDPNANEPQSKMDVLIGRIVHLHNNHSSSGANVNIHHGSAPSSLLHLNLHTQSRYVTQHNERQQQKSYYGVTLTDMRMMRDEFIEKTDLAYLQILQTKIPNSLGERLVDAKMIKLALSKVENGVDLTFENLFRAAYGTGQKCLPVTAMNQLLNELREEEEMRARHHPYSFRRFVTVTTAKDIESSFEAILHFLQPMQRRRVSQFGDVGITEDEYCSYMRRASSVMVTAEQAARLFRKVAVEQQHTMMTANNYRGSDGGGGGGGGGGGRNRNFNNKNNRKNSIFSNKFGGSSGDVVEKRRQSRVFSFTKKSSDVSSASFGPHVDDNNNNNDLNEDRQVVDESGGDKYDGELSSSDLETIPSSEDEEMLLKKKKEDERKKNFELVPAGLLRQASLTLGGMKRRNSSRKFASATNNKNGMTPINGSHPDEEHVTSGSSSSSSSSSSNSSSPFDDDDDDEDNIDNKNKRNQINGGSKITTKKKMKKHPNKKRKRMRRKKIVTVEEWALLILPNLKEKIGALKQLHAEHAQKDAIFQVGGSGNSGSGSSSANKNFGDMSNNFSGSHSMGTRKPTLVNFAPIIHEDDDKLKLSARGNHHHHYHLTSSVNPPKAVSFRV